MTRREFYCKRKIFLQQLIYKLQMCPNSNFATYQTAVNELAELEAKEDLCLWDVWIAKKG